MLKVYNSLSNKKEQFISINKNHVNMYVCGPTVYGDVHIGNARPVIFFDVVKKYLLHLGYSVNYVSNITDIDDKIINKAKELNIFESEITAEYIKRYKDVSLKVNSKLPDQMPKATEYVENMVEYIQNLINKGFAYANETGVYFRVSKVADYGILSNQNIDELSEGVRVSLEEKEDPRDFSVWKNTTDGISYDSPWGKGRPGWHTECAVMNKEIFQGEIDIHGGGSDLKFPHHENEIAQTKALDNHHLSKYWMHVGRLDMDKEKMSKSLGNIILVKDLLKDVNANAFRLLMLSHHYRQRINYSNDLMEQFIKEYDKIERSLKKAYLNNILNNKTKGEVIKQYITNFEHHMNDDFNTPNVISLIYEIVKELNKNTKNQNDFYETLFVIFEILGIVPNIDYSDEVLKTYKNWQLAREQKNYVKADELRSILTNQGWI